MKKIVVGMIVMIIAVMLVTSFVVTGFAQEEEAGETEALIEELKYEGFEVSEENPNFWTFYEEDVDDDWGHYMAIAWFDVENNIGTVVINYEIPQEEIEYTHESAVVRWIDGDFEFIGDIYRW